MDMSKYKSLFLSDTADHLEGLEGELVRLEGQPATKEQLHEIFRHLHSIKGMAASMQYEAMSLLAHRLEDLIAPHRQEGQDIGREKIELLLKGVDSLRAQLEQVRQNTPVESAPAGLLLSIERALAGNQQRPAAAPARDAVAPEALPGPEAGAGRWRLVLRIDPTSQLPAARAFVLLRHLEKLGRVVSCRPDVQRLRSGQLPEGRLEAVIDARLGREQLLPLLRDLPEAELLDLEAMTEAAAAPARLSLPTVRVQTELLDFFVDSVSELTALLGQFEELAAGADNPALRAGVRRLGSLVRRLRERVMEVRLVPATLLTTRLSRACHELARQAGKQVKLDLEGEAIELDRSLIEALDAPLMHLLRNAVAHGIEPPERRRAAGKAEQGTIRLGFSRSGERLQVYLRDDGAGIDAEQVRRRAAELHLAVGEGRDWLWQIISQPGFSTRERADQTAGRGVGLDAVRNFLEQVGGRLRLESWPGRGTCFSLDLPLSVAILPVLLVECSGVVLALPADVVARVQVLTSARVTPAEAKPALGDGEPQPLVLLEALLGGGTKKNAGECVILERFGHQLHLAVDRILGHREVVVKKPGGLLRSLGPYGGSAVLGDGRPVLVLDAQGLLETAEAGGGVAG